MGGHCSLIFLSIKVHKMADSPLMANKQQSQPAYYAGDAKATDMTPWIDEIYKFTQLGANTYLSYNDKNQVNGTGAAIPSPLLTSLNLMSGNNAPLIIGAGIVLLLIVMFQK